MRAALLCLAPALVASGCADRAPRDEPARFELAGCAAVLRGPVCEVTEEERTVRIRPAPDSEVRVTWAGTVITPAVTKPDGAPLLAVTLPKDAGDGTLTVIAEKARSRSTFRLPVRRAAIEPRLARVRALRREGRLADAAVAMPAPEAVEATFAGRAMSLRARLDLAAGRREAAISGFRAAMAIHRREGRASDEVRDAMALAHTLISDRRHAEARAALAQVAEPLADWDEGRAHIGYYRALLSRDTGDLRAALRDLAEAERGSIRLGIDGERRNARFVIAQVLVMLGRHDEARAVLKSEALAAPANESACRRAELASTLGWVELTAPEASAAPAEVTRIFDEARAFYEQGCPRPADLQNAHVNLALAALLEGDVDAAERRIEAARRFGAPPAWIALWLSDLEGRVALARGRAADALARYDALAERARDVSASDAIWRALLGRARALDALSRRADAIASLREAERLLDRGATAIPLDAGRASFFGHHGESAVLLAELLIQEGRAAEAMRAIRAARARAIASADRVDRLAALTPAQRARFEEAIAAFRREREALDAAAAEAWELAADKLPEARAALRAREERARNALDEAFAMLGGAAPSEGSVSMGAGPPPRDGELILLYQALPGGPARVYAEDARGVATSPIDLPPKGAQPHVVSRALLSPVADAIARATRIRVLATGPILHVDLHALPFGDAPLVARAPVVYAMDVPRAREPGAIAAKKALVVADPRNDLAAARGEIQRVEAKLAGGFAVTSLLGDAAERSRVLGALAGATLFHFGGHATFAGSTGWESALSLAGTGALSLGDILALPSAPRYVVLSGCETGRAPEASRVVDVSLAHAFASAGAEAVVAAVRPVRDDLAGALAEALYANAAARGWDLAEALRDAELALSRAKPDLDWASYRIITR